MKILTMHSDFIEFEPKKEAIKQAEKAEKSKKRVEECLVVFQGIEKKDEENPTSIAMNAVKEIEDVCKQVKVKRIVLYPWVHLTQKPAKPDIAMEVILEEERILKERDYEVSHAPFGWYKEFSIKVKGHPLAELSRDIFAEEKESKAFQAEKKMVSHWYILDLGGNLIPAEKFDYKKYPNLKKLYEYEHAKIRIAKEEPPHIKLMRSLELVDYEPGSDPGNLRYYPKGRLIKSLLEELTTNKIIEYGGMEVETPIMYDYEHPSLKNYLQRFPARQYMVESPNKKLFLRFSACFGQFLMAKDAVISYKDLPLRLYELTKYSFRTEKRGELAGLRRLRTFTMPDCHAICENVGQAKKEMLVRFELAKNVLQESGLDIPEDLECAIRMTKEFWKENADYVKKLVKAWRKPVLVELWDEQFFYFILKYDLNFVDMLDKATALTTDQIDIENAKNYGIFFIDKYGKKKHPILLHLSPSGAIERVIFALLEKEAIRIKQGKKPQLPLWLSPTQVRICPVSENILKDAVKLAEKIPFRVDIDDRELSIEKKIRIAELEWIPYILVYGEKEKNSGKLIVRYRDGKQKEMKLEELISEIKGKIKDKPFRRLSLPILLSKRPIFVG